MRRSLACFLIAVPLAVSACGTTVPQTQTIGGPSEVNAEPGITGPGQSQAGRTDSGVAAPGATGPSKQGATAGSQGTQRGSEPLPTGGRSGGPTSTVQGRGVTPTTLTIGMAVATGTDALANTFGISGAGSVSPQDIMNAVVSDVNKSGGILGRKLAVYVHSFDAAEGIANPEKTAAAICSDFRDDHKVFAVVFDIPLPSLRKCLADMGSPLLVQGGYNFVPAAAYAEHGGSFMYGVNAITTDRLAKLFIDSLMARSFNTPWNYATGGPGSAPVKLGVIHVDTPDQNALYAGYAKELAKHGLKFTDKVTYTQDAQAAIAATQSAVLKFRADGISHVFGASAFFLQYAESQKYRPRYAYLPGLGTIGTDNSPAVQLRGALTVGWSPVSDVKAAQDPGDNPAGPRCRAAMKAANLSTTNRADLKVMYGICDAVYSLRTALTTGGVPTVPGLRRGYEALGSRFGTALTFGALLGPNRHYGVNSVRDMAFDSDCACLKYTSRTNRS